MKNAVAACTIFTLTLMSTALGGGQKSEGTVWAPYNPNGLPNGFVVHLINEEGRRVSTEIIGLTGTVRVTEGYKEVPKVEESMFE